LLSDSLTDERGQGSRIQEAAGIGVLANNLLRNQRRCNMEVEIIGVGTMIALVWLIAWSMAGESESERRRIASLPDSGHSFETASGETRVRHAA
jgi:hypothetical protein